MHGRAQALGVQALHLQYVENLTCPFDRLVILDLQFARRVIRLDGFDPGHVDTVIAGLVAAILHRHFFGSPGEMNSRVRGNVKSPLLWV
jgi:hypothetical protein